MAKNSPFLSAVPVSRKSRPTHVDQNPLLPSFRRRSHATRDLELVKAVEKGYTLVKIHEVWHFPPEQRRTGLFYVNTWLKLKQESAGWPSWCQAVEQKRDYILRYQEREGIRLDIASIAKNPGRKATAKLMLNSFWGKFGERVNKPTTVTVKDPAHLSSLISDAAVDLSTLRLCTDDILEAVYTSVQENAVKGTKTNIFEAAFTTCHARLKLYESLGTLQRQVLYYDTYSVVYKWRPAALPSGIFWAI